MNHLGAERQAKKCSILAVLGISPYLVNGYINAKIASWPIAYWTFELIIWLAIPALILITLVRSANLKLVDLGFTETIFGRRSVILVLVASVLFCLFDYLVYAYAIGYARSALPETGIFQYHSVLPNSGFMRSMVAVYFALTAGIVEEIYFRGLLFKIFSLTPRAVPLFLVISPLLFAAIHWESGVANTAAAYVSGLASSIAFVLMRNIWPLIVGHIYTDYVLYE